MNDSLMNLLLTNVNIDRRLNRRFHVGHNLLINFFNGSSKREWKEASWESGRTNHGLLTTKQSWNFRMRKKLRDIFRRASSFLWVVISVSFLRRLELPRLTLPITLKALLTTNVALLRVPISSMFFFSSIRSLLRTTFRYLRVFLEFRAINLCASYLRWLKFSYAIKKVSRRLRSIAIFILLLYSLSTIYFEEITWDWRNNVEKLNNILPKKKIKTRRKFHLPHHIKFSQFISFSHIFAASKKKGKIF